MVSTRWFTRGWTLQELVASRDVKFFANDWSFLGTKTDHSAVLSSITGIHAKALRDKLIEDFSIAQRMSWASKRTTTRPEDIAYCLFGLFDVNMALLYSEGAEKAFVRLQEAIMSDSDDQSLFAWTQPTAKRTTMIGLLAKSPADFALSGDIIPVRDWRMSKPYSMTNAGLRINLLTTPPGTRRLSMRVLKGRFCIGLLNCVIDDGSLRLVAIHIYHKADEGDQHGRVNVCQTTCASPEHRAYCSRHTIFVRKKMKQDASEEPPLLEALLTVPDRGILNRMFPIYQLRYIEESGGLMVVVPHTTFLILVNMLILLGCAFGISYSIFFSIEIQGAFAFVAWICTFSGIVYVHVISRNPAMMW
jgi:hypothetical protein